MEVVKRRYHAPLRERQAAQTQERLASAAAVEFVERGWAGATVAAIAARAGVTPQAVYQSIGGKGALLLRAVESAVAGATDDTALVDRPSFAAAFEPGIGRTRRVAAFAAAAAEAYRRSAALFVVLQDAARSDEAVAAMAAAGAERRLADIRRLAALCRPDANPDVDAGVDALADAIWVLAGPALYADLVDGRGWSVERYRVFLETMVDAAIRRVEGFVG